MEITHKGVTTLHTKLKLPVNTKLSLFKKISNYIGRMFYGIGNYDVENVVIYSLQILSNALYLFVEKTQNLNLSKTNNLILEETVSLIKVFTEKYKNLDLDYMSKRKPSSILEFASTASDRRDKAAELCTTIRAMLTSLYAFEMSLYKEK